MDKFIGDIRPNSTVHRLSERNYPEAKFIPQAIASGKNIFAFNLINKAIVEGSLRIALPKSEADVSPDVGIGTARTYFDIKLMKEELLKAREMNMEEESLPRVPWGYVVNIIPTPVEEIRQLVDQGLEKAAENNKTLLARLHGQIYDSFGDDVDVNKMSPSNIPVWQELVLENRELESGLALKDWNIVMDNNGKPRARRLDEPLFLKTEVCTRTDVEFGRKISEVSKNNSLAKVVIIANEQGFATGVEVWFNHYLADEEQGREVIKSVFENIKIDKMDTLETQILRSVTVNEKGHEHKRYDIVGQAILSHEEQELFKMTCSTFEKRMPLSVFLTESWLAMSGQESAYLMVKSDVSAGLQLALLPRAYEVKRIVNLMNRIETSLKNQTFRLDRERISRQILELSNDPWLKIGQRFTEYLSYVNTMAWEQIEAARKDGANAISIIGNYTADSLRKFFKIAFKKEDKFVSRGSLQTSMIGDATDVMKDGFFITGLNIHSTTALGGVKTEGGLKITVRQRTDKKDYKNAITSLKWGSTAPIRKVESFFKNRLNDQIQKYKRYAAVFALVLSERNIRYNKTLSSEEKDKQLIKLYSLADKALMQLFVNPDVKEHERGYQGSEVL